MSNARSSQTFAHAQPRPSLAPGLPPPVTLVSCGYSLPACCVDNRTLARELQVDEDWIVARSGIHHRFCASPEETTASLGAAAARQALDLAPGFVPD